MSDGLPFLRLMMYTIKTEMMISTTITAAITPPINPPLGPAVLASWFPEKKLSKTQFENQHLMDRRTNNINKFCAGNRWRL